MLDGEYVIIMNIEFPQGIREVDQVFRVRAAWSGRGMDLAGDDADVSMAQPGVVFDPGDIYHTFNPIAVFQFQVYEMPFVTVFFAMVERTENLSQDIAIDQEGNALALLFRLGNQRDHPARGIRGAAVIVGTLPESPFEVTQAGFTPLLEFKTRPPYQGAVTE